MNIFHSRKKEERFKIFGCNRIYIKLGYLCRIILYVEYMLLNTLVKNLVSLFLVI